MQLILASNSPRRRDILTKFGFNFEVRVSNCQEQETATNPQTLATNNALIKATEVFKLLDCKLDKVVLGADTIVVFDGKILGKPISKQNAIQMLSELSNKTHTVITGYAILSQGLKIVGFDLSWVLFNRLSKTDIERYVQTGLCMDKAGAYGIQDGFNLVKNVKGSTYNVIGLPIEKIIDEFNKNNLKF